VRQQKETIWNEVRSKTCCEGIQANYLYIWKFVLKSAQSNLTMLWLKNKNIPAINYKTHSKVCDKLLFISMRFYDQSSTEEKCAHEKNFCNILEHKLQCQYCSKIYFTNWKPFCAYTIFLCHSPTNCDINDWKRVSNCNHLTEEQLLV
jgi:hypothetical protein